MCNFLSALIFGPRLELKFGRFYSDPLTTDSHTELEAKLGLPDRHADPEWAKVEYTPGPKGLGDFDGYAFQIDETITPDWLTEDLIEEFKVYAMAKLADIIIASGTHDLIGTPKKAICGTAIVKKVTAKIGSVSGSANIGWVSDSANIDRVSGSANIRSVSGSANIGWVSDSANIDRVSDSAKIGWVSDSANIGSVYDSAVVIITKGSPTFKLRKGSSALGIDRRTSPQTIYGKFQAFVKPKRVKKEESNA